MLAYGRRNSNASHGTLKTSMFIWHKRFVVSRCMEWSLTRQMQCTVIMCVKHTRNVGSSGLVMLSLEIFRYPTTVIRRVDKHSQAYISRWTCLWREDFDLIFGARRFGLNQGCAKMWVSRRLLLLASMTVLTRDNTTSEAHILFCLLLVGKWKMKSYSSMKKLNTEHLVTRTSGTRVERLRSTQNNWPEGFVL